MSSQTERIYIHAILFGWQPDLEMPFEIYPRDALGDDVNSDWFSGKFGIVERKKILHIPSIDEDEDNTFSMFCKIERGMLKQLNEKILDSSKIIFQSRC